VEALLPWKTISIMYSVGVTVALVIQHALRVRLIILSSVAGLAVTYTFTLSHNGVIFDKTFVNVKYVF